MLMPNSESCIDPSTCTASIGDGGTGRNTCTLLKALLAHSIRLRDLYKKACWQIADIQFHHLRVLFDAHCKEQSRLIDVLIDRIRMLGGADGVFAGAFLQGTRFSCALRGRTPAIRLLQDLLDAHELVLSAVHSSARGDSQNDGASTRDFAVGQVALANELQSRIICEQLIRGDVRRRFSEAQCADADA
jgi:DNA-binding ferritin-like protein